MRVGVQEGEDSTIDAFAVGEVTLESPAVTAERYDHQRRRDAVGGQGFVE